MKRYYDSDKKLNLGELLLSTGNRDNILDIKKKQLETDLRTFGYEEKIIKEMVKYEIDVVRNDDELLSVAIVKILVLMKKYLSNF